MGGRLRMFAYLVYPQTAGFDLLQIPFKDFVLTNAGELVPHQVQMYRERIRTVGISLLGGNSGVEGRYELGIDSISAVNIEDVTDKSALGMLSVRLTHIIG